MKAKAEFQKIQDGFDSFRENHLHALRFDIVAERLELTSRSSESAPLVSLSFEHVQYALFQHIFPSQGEQTLWNVGLLEFANNLQKSVTKDLAYLFECALDGTFGIRAVERLFANLVSRLNILEKFFVK